MMWTLALASQTPGQFSSLPYHTLIHHTPFLKALGSAKSPADPLWRAVAAGYLVLRFFDEWVAQGEGVGALNWSIIEIRDRIYSYVEMEPELRRILLSIADAFTKASQPNTCAVVESWSAYAAYLETAGYPILAHHIYGIVYGEFPQSHAFPGVKHLLPDSSLKPSSDLVNS